jgi:hypothetical protein
MRNATSCIFLLSSPSLFLHNQAVHNMKTRRKKSDYIKSIFIYFFILLFFLLPFTPTASTSAGFLGRRGAMASETEGKSFFLCCFVY